MNAAPDPRTTAQLRQQQQRRRWGLGVLAALTVVTTASTQLAPNMHYDGRVTVARLKYTPVTTPEACQGADSPAGAGWGHDYPMSVQGLMKAVTELLRVEAAPDSNLVLTVEDPELLKHPIAMLTEPGCWDPTEKEANLNYLVYGLSH